MKEQVDIEQLLEWAYRLQCVERRVQKMVRQRPALYPSAASFAAFADLGTRVDVSGFQSSDVTRVERDDALVVHDAVLGLGDAWLEWRGPDEVVIWTRETAAAWGYALEKQGHGWAAVRNYTSGDAAPEQVRGLQFVSVSVLVILHAKQGLRPATGEAQALAGQHQHRRRQLRAHEMEERLRSLMEDRALYMVWHQALCRLTRVLAGRLSRSEVLPPMALESPWAERSRIIHKEIPALM